MKITGAGNDNRIGIIFHNTEHLKVDENDAESVELNKKRNVLGFFDGRPIEILPLPKEKSSAVSVHSKKAHDLLPYPCFAAHKDGALEIEAGREKIRYDISFDDLGYC